MGAVCAASNVQSLLRRVFLTVVFLVRLGNGRDASAAPPSDAGAPGSDAEAKRGQSSLSDTLTGEAKTAYEDGRVFLAGDEFARAHAKFELAYNRSKDPRLLWNMALAQKSLHHYVKAQALLRRFLTESRNLDDSDRIDAENLIRTFEVFTGTLQLTTQPANGNRVLIDAVEVGTTPVNTPLQLDLGEHDLRVEREGFVGFRTTVRIDSHEAHRADVVLRPGDNAYPSCSRTTLSWEPAGRIIVKARSTARVFIDDVEMGEGHTECVLPAGAHTVSASAAFSRTYLASTNVTVAPGGTVEVAGRKQLAALAEESRGSSEHAARRSDTEGSWNEDEAVKPSSTSGHGCGCRLAPNDRDRGNVPLLAFAVAMLAASRRRRP